MSRFSRPSTASPRHAILAPSLALSVALVALGACRTNDGPVVTPDAGQLERAPDKSIAFENPGGMWMPSQMLEHRDTLASLGLAYDPSALADPSKAPLNAVVSLGFCSGSFISAEGLIATNHHCAVPVALQFNSTAERNLTVTGYMAKTRKDELWAGPNQRIFVTTAFKEVTPAVYEGTKEITDPTERLDRINKNRAKLEQSCEAGRAEVDCTIASYFEGAVYFQIEQLALRDIRLVYAPHAGVGVFGGEIDNWRWPRHTGDFSLLRAYVGPDGKPADYSENNVPYKPAHHLPMASEPLQAGDFVMVAGYPGRTNRLKTALEAKNAADWFYPYAIARYEQNIAVVEALAKQDAAIGVKANRQLRGWHNGLTNNKGMLDGLVGGGLAATKKQEEEKLEAWIAADPARAAKYGGVIAKIDEADRALYAFQRQDAAANEILGAAVALGRAMQLKGIATAQAPDAKDAGADKRLADWRTRLDASQRSYDERLDKALLVLALERAAALPEAEQPKAIMDAIVGSERTREGIVKKVDALYAKTKLGDAEAVLALVGKPHTIKANKDSMIKLAYALSGATAEADARQKKYGGLMAELRPIYVEALREYAAGQGKTVAPDANSTLRITYGTVRGYSPGPGKPVYRPFSTVSEMVKKHTGQDPFDAPENVRNAIAERRFGPYAAADLGEVPLDFLADLDITGGNSGSACMNRAGRLVGLAFDGNYEAMASDWIFLPELTRSIQVDARYMLWLLDAVDGGDHLLREMGVEPAIE